MGIFIISVIVFSILVSYQRDNKWGYLGLDTVSSKQISHQITGGRVIIPTGLDDENSLAIFKSQLLVNFQESKLSILHGSEIETNCPPLKRHKIL